jgi:hypothetical protein
MKKVKAIRLVGYVKKQQINGKWRIVEVTDNYQTKQFKTRTLYKDLSKGKSEDILFRLEKGIKI